MDQYSSSLGRQRLADWLEAGKVRCKTIRVDGWAGHCGIKWTTLLARELNFHSLEWKNDLTILCNSMAIKAD